MSQVLELLLLKISEIPAKYESFFQITLLMEIRFYSGRAAGIQISPIKECLSPLIILTPTRLPG